MKFGISAVIAQEEQFFQDIKEIEKAEWEHD
jgi:hypothetical protein